MISIFRLRFRSSVLWHSVTTTSWFYQTWIWYTHLLFLDALLQNGLKFMARWLLWVYLLRAFYRM